MSLRIIKAGIADTLQDTGRYGWQHLGINPTGAMDKFAAAIANVLVGNSPQAPVIEMHFPASVFLIQQPTLLALAGADFAATINGEALSPNQPVIVNKNCVIQFHKPKKGARAYMAVHGSYDIPLWMNSYSTHLKAKAGGFHGRALQKDDEIVFNPTFDFSSWVTGKDWLVIPWQADAGWSDVSSDEIFFLPGNEWDWLTEEAQENFMEQNFVITPDADRMGYRLSGELLISKLKDELISTAVCFGTVQLLPDGRLILLMADHQSTGGYPRIAHVISAHHSRLAQMKPGNQIRFRTTSQETAEELLRKQYQHICLLENSCQLKLKELLHA